jgi:serine/threonine-protein phosphatase PPG1
LRKYNSHEVWK